MIFESSHCPDDSYVQNKFCQNTVAQANVDRVITPERVTPASPDSTRPKLPAQTTQALRQVFLFTPSRASNPEIQAALVKLQNQVAAELRSKGLMVQTVPNGLDSTSAIAWINRRASSGSLALSIQTDAFLNPDARGTAAFFRAGNPKLQQQAESLIKQILGDVPTLVNRGARPDTETAFGNLPFVRQLKIPAIALSIGFSTSPQDRTILLNRTQAIAQGIAKGIVPKPIEQRTTQIRIRVNGQLSENQGLLLGRNAYLPIALLNGLTIDFKRPRAAQLITYRNMTYIRAIDLRGAGAVVGWNSPERTLVVETVLPNSNRIGRVMGRGYLSKATLQAFLQQNNPQALRAFPEIIDLYLEEASIEGVNADIAFTQALLETNFFRFGTTAQPDQNNFAALKEVGVSETATFPNARTGVRAHIQMLKTYASIEPLAQEAVTPRFRFIARGVAPQIEQLAAYYSADPRYAKKIIGALKQLYQYQFDRLS
ncbi:glucosaminidase domain-containing protein [Leptolyngbya sp. NIES-2104]|uniref:glucosaminidase domain-containing protein n=1 Tax=Leptolyngbya sp. NIES-2104 TaxID=1552121 RepID=UPI00073EA7C0|nr:N-acetylmuramoyl-L-alanine amidase [Leptolyngbya sp. NIES-2104]